MSLPQPVPCLQTWVLKKKFFFFPDLKKKLFPGESVKQLKLRADCNGAAVAYGRPFWATSL